MIRDVRALQAGCPQVPVRLHADMAATQTFATPAIAYGGKQRCSVPVTFDLPAEGQVLFQPSAQVRPQVGNPVVETDDASANGGYARWTVREPLVRVVRV